METTSGAFTFQGMPIIEDPYIPSGELYLFTSTTTTASLTGNTLVVNPALMPFGQWPSVAEFQGVPTPFKFRTRDIPEVEPEVQEFVRGIRFDD